MWQDVRFGLRILSRTPGVTAVAVLALALGIGANTAIFSLVHALMLRPLPYAEAERLVVPATVFGRQNTDRGSVAYADFLDWKARTELFEAVAAYSSGSVDSTGGDEPERLQAMFVSEDYFRVMAAAPAAGRTFRHEEFLPGAGRGIVISYGLWMRRFGGDPNVVGTSIELGGISRPILGVMPKDSMWPDRVDLFGPLAVGPTPSPDILRRDNHIFQAVARLKRGVTLERAQALLNVMAKRVEQENPVTRKGTAWKLHRLNDWIVGPQIQQTLVVLVAAVVFVLLVGCVNVANLLLARAAAREREVAIRTALGAGWRRLVRQLLTESLLLAGVGGAAGLLLGYWGMKALVRWAPAGVPRLEEVSLNPLVLAFTAGVSMITALLFGLMPAMETSKSAPIESLREGGRTASGGLRAKRMRSVLVIGELALAIVLLAGAGLMIRSFFALQQVKAGFPVENLITMRVSLPGSRYRGPQVADGFARIVEQMRQVPGVISVSATQALPMNGGGFYLGRAFLYEGQPEPPASNDVVGMWNAVQPGYFRTMGIPILQGRDFTERDSADGQKVMIVNQAFARQMFPDQDPIGRRVRSWRDENVYREIVGVAADILNGNLTARPGNMVYVPHRQNSWNSLVLVARSQGDPRALAGPLRSAIWSVDRKLAVANVDTMENIRDAALARPRFSMFLLAVFAATALVLAAVGLYGVMAFGVVQRTHEIGVRMALGAHAGDVVRMIVKQGLVLAAAGIGVGAAGAFALTRLMATLLFGVQPSDATAFAGALALLTLAALAASYLPARRAASVDPVIALRHE